MEPEALALMAVVSFVGLTIACCMAVDDIARRNRVKPVTSLARIGWCWAWCPRGHAKAIIAVPRPCPVCGDAMECA